MGGCCWEVHATRAGPKESLSYLPFARSRWFPFLGRECAATRAKPLLGRFLSLSHCNETMNVAVPDRWVASSSWSIANAPSCHHRAFWCHVSGQPDGSHLFTQINSKHHGQAFRHLAPDFATGLVVFPMRILCRSGFRPTGPLWHYTSCNKEEPIELPTHLGWTKRRLRLILKSSGRRQGPSRRMQFKVDYRDGDKESNIRMLTGTIKADWIQLLVERYLAALPTLRQGVIAGVFRNKAAPWAITRAEKLQPRFFFPMTCHWMIGVQEFTPCPLCGLTCPCWEPPICAGRSAMTFTTYGRSMTS